MQQLNSLIIEGNVVRDPELKETPKGTSVCNFSLASNRAFKSGDAFEKEVSFFSVEAWGKLAEITAQNCPKGRGIRVVGRLKQGRWTGIDGKNYSKTFIVAEHIEFKPIFNKLADSEQLAAEKTPAYAPQEELIPAF